MTKAREYARIYKFGKQAFSSHFRLFYKKAQDQNPTRFGFVISKKQVGKIVARNRLKRILRARVAALFPAFFPGFEVIVQARTQLPSLTTQEVHQELTWLLTQAKLMKKND